ncbi:MAG: hypothetical protein J6N68_10060 [Shewanella sp.]|nr:hypothetical protein [Shewanella sp.]
MPDLYGSTDDPSQASNRQHKSKDGFIVGLENNPNWVNDVDTNQETDAWQRIRQGFQLQDHLDNPRIDQQRYGLPAAAVQLKSSLSAATLTFSTLLKA